MPDYDTVVIGSGFAGSTATLSFLETAEKAGQVGRVALIETGKNGTWPGASRRTKPFLRLDHPPATSMLRSSTFGCLIGANVAGSLPETAADIVAQGSSGEVQLCPHV